MTKHKGEGVTAVGGRSLEKFFVSTAWFAYQWLFPFQHHTSSSGVGYNAAIAGGVVGLFVVFAACFGFVMSQDSLDPVKICKTFIARCRSLLKYTFRKGERNEKWDLRYSSLSIQLHSELSVLNKRVRQTIQDLPNLLFLPEINFPVLLLTELYFSL